MARPKKEEVKFETPILPPFPSEKYDVTIMFLDEKFPDYICHTMAKGRAQAIVIACYTMTQWEPEKISAIAGLTVNLV